MDNNELLKFCKNYNELIYKNSRQGDSRMMKYVDADGKICSVWIIIDKHMYKQKAMRISEIMMEQLLEDQSTDEDI